MGNTGNDTNGTGTVSPAVPGAGMAPLSGRLALRPAEAARALGISARLLWSLTDRNEIPHARIGRAVVYSVDRLREWLNERTVESTGAR